MVEILDLFIDLPKFIEYPVKVVFRVGNESIQSRFKLIEAAIDLFKVFFQKFPISHLAPRIRVYNRHKIVTIGSSSPQRHQLFWLYIISRGNLLTLKDSAYGTRTRALRLERAAC